VSKTRRPEIWKLVQKNIQMMLFTQIDYNLKECNAITNTFQENYRGCVF
ncbi:unnamed protein product, partial [Allacma fusca]